MDVISQKMAELEDRMLKSVKAQNDNDMSELKSQYDDLSASFEDFKKNYNRFQAGEQKSEWALGAAIKKIADPDLLKSALKDRKSFNVDIGGNPYDLEKKTIDHDGSGNQTISGDVRRVLANLDRPGIIPFRMRPPAIRDLLSVVPTTAEYINYVRETANTNNAAWVAMGNTKPESALTLQVERSMVETIATVITCPLQLASDIPAFQAFLANKLVAMLRVASEDSYLYGTGTSPDILGITQFPNIQSGTQTENYNRIDTIRVALNALETSFYPWADNLIIHPNDAMKMELLKDLEGRYLWPIFGSWANGVNAQKSLFGVPVISTTAIDEGTFIAGNFAQGATLYQREAVSVRVSFEHLDYFQKNLMMLLVESREALVPEDGKCFYLGAFLGGDYD
jgi:HK97 family phage major capsid protein